MCSYLVSQVLQQSVVVIVNFSDTLCRCHFANSLLHLFVEIRNSMSPIFLVNMMKSGAWMSSITYEANVFKILESIGAYIFHYLQFSNILRGLGSLSGLVHAVNRI